MKSIVLISFLLAFNLVFSQYPQLDWAGSVGTNLTDYCTDVQVDQDGNVYLLGNFGASIPGVIQPPSSALDLYFGSNLISDSTKGEIDIFLVKLDPFGNHLWSKTWGSVGNDLGVSVEVGASGNVYVLGHYADSIEFETGVTALSEISFGRTFILKLTTSGNVLWVKTFGVESVSSGLCQSTEMVIDADENIYTTGYLYNGDIDFDPDTSIYILTSNPGVMEYYVQKLDSSGSFDWAMIGQAAYGMYPRGIDVDMNNNIVVVGKSLFQSSQPNGPWSGNQIFVDKLDQFGNLSWNYTSENDYQNTAYDVKYDSSGNIYVCGVFSDSIDFDPGSGTAIHIANAILGDAFILKLNAAGNYEWANSYGRDLSGTQNLGKALAVDDDKNVYLIGSIADSVDFDPSSNTALLESTDMLIKLDSAGDFLWVVENISGNEIMVNNLKDIYIVGGFDSIANTDFDPNIGVVNLSNTGAEDGFIQKFFQCTNETSIEITECDNYYWSLTDSVYSFSTVDYYTSFNQNGCDSIIVLHLEIENLTATASFSQSENELIANSVGSSYQWVNCSDNYSIIPGETNQNFIPTVNGSYAVIVSNDVCSDTSNCLSTSLGFEDYNGDALEIYPNPTSRYVDIKVVSEFQMSSINIYSISGALLYQLDKIDSNNQRIYLYFEGGVYIFEIISNGEKHYKRVVKM